MRSNAGLANVRYEILGKRARRASALERQGYDIISMNIGNPYAFGFRTPVELLSSLRPGLTRPRLSFNWSDPRRRSN